MGNIINILGILILLFFVIYIGVYYFKKFKLQNKMLQLLNQLAKENNCKIDTHEYCGDFVLGIDESKDFVFFFKQRKEEAISQFVDLSEIQTCQMVKKTRNVKNDIGSLGFIERVELSFIPTNKTKGETRFELYDEEINMQLSGELQFVDKWTKQINDRLKNKK
jgi:hypothetical protein